MVALKRELKNRQMIRNRYFQCPELTATNAKSQKQLCSQKNMLNEFMEANLRLQPNPSVTGWYGLFQSLCRSVKP